MSQNSAPGLRSRSYLFLFVIMVTSAVLLGQIGPSWALPNQNALRDTIGTRVPTPPRGPTSTPSPTTGPCTGRILLQDVDTVGGYQGTTDTWIHSGAATFPQPKLGGLKVKGAEGKSALIRFELQGVPPGANVTRAQLTFYVDSAEDTRTLNVAAYRVARPWSEAQATWRDADLGVRWGTVGCNGVPADRTDVADDTITLNGWGVYRGLDVTSSVRYWLQHPDENYGWLLKGVGPSTAEYGLGSSRNQFAGYRPVLCIDYELCGYTTTPTRSPQATATPTATPSPTKTPLPSTTVSLIAVEDTYISEWEPQSNFGSALYIRCYANSIRKMLVRFDLTSLPVGARVISATLHLWTEPTGSATVNLNVGAYRVRRRWDESAATWQMATAAQRWSTAGAASTVNDYYDVLLDTQTVAAIGREYVWNVTSALQEWLRLGAQNYGFLLVGGAGTQVLYSFVSSEALTASTRPRLIIQYTTVPETTPTPTPSPTRTATATPQLGTLFVTVYNDANLNRVPDVGEPGIPGVVIQLLDSSRLVLDSRVTGEDGTCVFTDLPLGMGLRVREQNPTWCASSTADEYRLYVGRYLAVAFGDYVAPWAVAASHEQR